MIRLLVFCLGLMTALHGQVTFRIVNLPSNTPQGAPIYIAGSFNNWNEANPDYLLDSLIDGDRTITLPIQGSITCKFTRGTWVAVEGNSQGSYLPNRQFTVQPLDTLLISILSWEDLGVVGSPSTALPSVSLMDASFFIPQLNRSRKIWVRLPENYASATETRYRVVYMQDGQNMFDDALAFNGEWGIDESMRDLELAGDPGAIIVGIENGGFSREAEYSAWANPTYGGGDGDEYVDFMRNTLKPHIDANYRTKPEAEHTAIMGSSLGGLISFYGGVKYPETFGRIGAFSPSFWFNINELPAWLQTRSLPEWLRVYSVAGTLEWDGIMTDIYQAHNILDERGVENYNLKVQGETDGSHAEWFWKREFPDAYTWLFSNTLNTDKVDNSRSYKLFPNPSNSQLNLSSSKQDSFVYRVSAIDGREMIPLNHASSNTSIDIGSWPAGLYLVWAGKAGEVLRPFRFIHE
jgi:enterochelin esterase-like enzyme